MDRSIEKDKVTITEDVRNEIPKILKRHRDGLNFNDLFDELKKVFKDRLVNENGDRTGVLRGIVNKHETKPVKNMTIEKRSSGVYYVYVSGQLSELERVVKVFLDEVNSKELLKVTLFDLDKDERQRFKDYEDAITKLYDLTYYK